MVNSSDKWARLAVLSPARTGAMPEQKSLFDDCWGTVVDIDIQMREDEDEMRFYNQQVLTVLVDNTDISFPERGNLPTNEATGELKVDEEGKLVRAHRNSKVGQQEVLYNSLSVPWEGEISNILGIHGHFVRKGTKRTREDIAREQAARAAGEKTKRSNEPPYGRYLVEWDRYDNDVRKRAGLPAITATASSIKVEAVQGDVPAIEELAEGRSFIELLTEVRTKYPSLTPMTKREEMNRLVSDGVLRESIEDGKTIYRRVEG